MNRKVELSGGQTLSIPPEVDSDDLLVIASVSGGKDSTAMMLALAEADVEHRAVFADTGWEAPETYAYLDELRRLIGPIDTVGHPGGMAAKIRENGRFPSRRQRWCTRELKIQPLRAYHDAIIEDTGMDTICCVGVRADESRSRANLRPFVDEPPGSRSWGGFIWRPLLHWTVADVLDIHARHNIPVNPLYHAGHDRVGCYPCCMENKEGIRLVALRRPERIDEIRSLEEGATDLRKRRNAQTPGRYKYEQASFFLRRAPGDDPCLPIDDAVAWSNTSHGGRELLLFPPAPTGGCVRWGLCDLVSDVHDQGRMAKLRSIAGSANAHERAAKAKLREQLERYTRAKANLREQLERYTRDHGDQDPEADRLGEGDQHEDR